MRRKTTREILTDSFKELVRSKPVDKITVREITENCGYSQATFYRQFKGKYDLIAWEHSQRVGAIMARVGVDGYSLRRAMLDSARAFQEERDYLANLFRHTGGHDSFVMYMAEANYETLKRHLLQHSGEEELDRLDDMSLRCYAYGTVSLTCEWILGSIAARPEELADVYERTLPEPLRGELL